MRVTFHLGEDEVPRFEIASHVSGPRPGVRAQGGGVTVRTARGCGKVDGSRGSRGGGRGRMPRGVPTRLRGRAWRAVKAQKPEGRGRKGGTGEGEEEGEGWGGGERVRGEPPPASRASARPPQPES